jgi:hypothetical protein
LQERGVEFLVFPRSTYNWLDEHSAVRGHLMREHRFVTRQEHVCAVYELCPRAAAGAPRSDRRARRFLAFLRKRGARS